MLAAFSSAATDRRAAAFPGIAGNAQPAAGHLPNPLAPAGTVMRIERDAQIVAQGDRAQYCFLVVSGCVRTVKVLEDGRRHVGAFLLPGDVFGWEAAERHAFAAEAVTPAAVRRTRLSTIEDRADADPAFARRLRQYVAAQGRMAQEHLVLLGRKTASERIASFLLQMHERLGGPGRSAAGQAVVELPMSRADIADHLGLTIETVCRQLTELRRHGVIAVERTRIAIRDQRALGLAGSDRLH